MLGYDGDVHGAVFLSIFAFVSDRHGRDGPDELLREMAKRRYSGPMGAAEFQEGERYPLQYLDTLLRTYMELHGEEKFDAMARGTATRGPIVRADSRWKGRPGQLFKKVNEHWRENFEYGRLVGAMIFERVGMIVGDGVSPNQLFCRFLSHYFQGLLESIGLEVVSVEHSECAHEMGGRCAWEFHWKGQHG